MADTSSRIPDEKGFDSAAAAVRSEPERADRWDQVEALGEPLERAAAIAALYSEILAKELTPAAATVVGQRAVAFFEEWFPEDEAALTEALRRVLAVVPDDEWAFQRLTAVLTLNERWSELLALYDQTLKAPIAEARRIQILEEATDIARDFAGQPDHAVDYMHQLLGLRPADARLEAALERLLEKQSRHRDLISLYKRRIGLLGREASEGLPVKIAELWLDRLAQPGEALEEVRGLLQGNPADQAGWALLERILVLPEASTAVRTGALDLLRSSYDGVGKRDEVIRILGVALGFADPQASIGLHRELGERLVVAGQPAAALEHYVAVVELLPGSVDDHRRLRHLAELHGEHALHVKGLTAAAGSEADAGRRAVLWAEAGDVQRETLRDAASAIELYQKVLGEPQADHALALRVARLLDDLLAQSGQAAERLTVLERLGELESGPPQTTVLGEAAKLAFGSGDLERSLKSWRARLALDAEDVEALAAAVEVLTGLGRWGEVVDVLRQRAGGPVPAHQRRADLRQIAAIQAEQLADLPGAIATWQEFVREFGESDETVEALASLLAKVTRWPDLSDLLDRAAGRGTARLADLSTRLGEVFRVQLARPGRAVACYDAALTADPAHPGARAGLLATLETEGRQQAVEVLGKLYRGRGEWAELAAIVDARLAGAEGDAVRQVDILRETARLHEAHTGDKAAAVAALARAFPLAPADRAIERDLLRLSEETGDFRPATAAFHSAAGVTIAGEPHRATELRLAEARLAEHKLNDAASALTAYQAVLSAVRGDAEAVRGAIRSAAVVGDFSAVAHALLGQIVADQKIDDATLALAEGLAGEHGGWDRLTLSLEAAANAARSTLAPDVYAFLAARVAQWHRDQRGDFPAAREALLRSVAARPGQRERLEMLADLQREAPEPALIDTLLALDQLSETDFDHLYEASELALGLLGDTDITRDILQRLLARATALWSRGVATTGRRSNADCVGWAAQKLAQLSEQDGDRRAAAELLAKTATLPFEQAVSQNMRVRAAATFAELGDRQRAIGLYETALDTAPDDLEVLRLLGPLLEAEERFPELLKLRKHELSREPDAARRLALRLEIARLVGVIEQRGGRVEALRHNLRDDPSHDPSLAALTAVLGDRASPDELAKFLGEHAERLEQVADKPRAIRLWTQLAELAERRIGDVELALASHRRAAALTPEFHNLDALARLHMARREPAEAVPWLTERLVRTPDGPERTDIVLGLSDALLGAGRNIKAIEVLSRAVADHPAEARTRDLLIRLEREAGDWEPLASLLQVAAEHTSEREQVLAFLYEAAEIVRDKLGELDRAIPVLERLHALVPDDRGVLVYLGDALISGERWEHAQQVLERLLADFGRRRPPERAKVHYKLAQVARALGDDKAALAQLELATAIDVGDVASLQMLAELSRDTGDLARAERSYRALLLAARRRGVDGDEKLIGIAEAQYELSRLAEGRGQADLAQELLGSAVDAALQDDREARKLQRALRSRGDAPLLVRVLRSRLEAAQEPASRAAILADLGDALDATGQADEALGLRLQALQDDPGATELHKAAAEQAARLGHSARYVDAVIALVDRARRKQDAGLQADLLLRAAEIVEREFADHDRAAELYSRVEAGGQRVVEAWMGLARIAATKGDSARQIELLERIAGSTDDTMSPEVRARAAFGLAEIRLAAPESRDAGVAAMRRALQTEPRLDVAEPILRRAVAAAPDHKELGEMYEQIVRKLGDKSALLAYLESKVAGDVDPKVAQDASDLALELGEAERSEKLLVRMIELSGDREGSGEFVAKTLLTLAGRRKAAGDLRGAVDYVRDSAAHWHLPRAFELGLELAGLAAAQPDQLALAAEIYEDLLLQEPSNKAVWAPLMDVYRKSGDASRLQQLVESTLPSLADVGERNALRLDLVPTLLQGSGHEQDVVRLLKDVLMEEPGHKQAERLLAEVFEKTGYDSELVDLLNQQLLTAQGAGDTEGVIAASLRLGDLLRKTQPDEAVSVFRTALDFAPQSRQLIEALLALLDADHDPHERAEIGERLLAIEAGEAAVRLALDLAGQYDKLGDREAVSRVLEAGYKLVPESDALRERLEGWYRERGEFERLAALLVSSAERAIDPTKAVGLLREASSIHVDQLMDAAKSAEVLRIAVAIDPNDNDLLREFIGRLCDTGEHASAVEELTKALDWRPLERDDQVEFLRRRAELRMIVGDEARATADLEEAYGLVGAELIPDLIDGLERWRSAAAKRDDRDGERTATMRLVDILRKEGAEDQARHALAGWVEHAPGDTDALRQLTAMDIAAGRWESVIESATRLVAAESGEEQIKAVMQLVEATEKVGRPGDAQAGLEAAHHAQPKNEAVRARLKQIYEESEDYPALARLLIAEAGTIADDSARFLVLRQAGELLLDEDAAAAAEALKQALKIRPTDQSVNLLLVEAYAAAEQFEEADAILDAAIEALKGRRTPDLCALQYRKAMVAGAHGNYEQELHWLKEAHNTDRNNGDVAVALAALAEKLEDYDLAIRVLRSIALMEAAPMSRAVAYLRQGYIAERRGDRQKAVLWGRKALMEDPNCTEASDFLRSIGEL
ncbi:tetratricopeptide repeat protein [Nannocystis sp. SCPEA4]|uniref:tetratricopeptide repeat protein n=1 Tax=Nannocystis sp. SCPEA4 TaxID=2996787 RepID=UPI00226F040C|nr:tetratricopeptide repeat protein [Nannocystis sp. SCPEA4]MCY1058477.1 tetratricopeptide repeat protein [Nannocystis sp. SCPEA4]